MPEKPSNTEEIIKIFSQGAIKLKITRFILLLNQNNCSMKVDFKDLKEDVKKYENVILVELKPKDERINHPNNWSINAWDCKKQLIVN